MEIGLDIGLKNITIALMDNDRVVKCIDESIYEGKRDSHKAIMEKILIAIHKLCNSYVKGIGISLPSLVDKEKGIVFDVQKIPYWEGARIKKILEDQFKTKVWINHDMNCFLLGEKFLGQCQEFQNIISIILEKNIGTSIIMNNKLLLKNKRLAAETECLSNIYYDCVRLHKKKYLQTLEELSYICRTMSDNLYDSPNDKKWDEIGILVGRLLAIMLCNYDSQIIVLGGNVGKSFSNFVHSMDYYLEKKIHSRILHEMIVITSEVENPKAVGAAYMVSHEC